MQAAAAASATTYRSFADATRSVLDLLERHLPPSAVFLAHLDRGQDIHRVVDTRGGAAFGLRSNQSTPLATSFCFHMADGHAPRRCNDVGAHPLYGRIARLQGGEVGAYLGVPLELSDGSKVGSLAAVARGPGHFSPEDERLLTMLGRVLAYELERETNERDLRRLNESLRGHARGMAALARIARALATAADARPDVCDAACEAAMAPVAFLLEPDGRDFVSTAMRGVEMAPVTIQARGEDRGAGRGFMGVESYFVADARNHPSLAPPLVEATSARSALFEPVVREGRVIGVLIVIWHTPVDRLDEATSSVLRLVAAQAGVAIEQAVLRARVDSLALTDGLTGLVTGRAFDDEVPRELARARRSDSPVCVGLVDLDHMGSFNLVRGEREGDRLIKEAAAAWAGALREVDLIARVDGQQFGVLLPGCGLGEACEVLDRLRGLTPRGQTASAGVARWDGAEPADMLFGRAREALAGAKAAGRDLTLPAD